MGQIILMSFNEARQEKGVGELIINLSFLGRKLFLENYFGPFDHFYLYLPLEDKRLTAPEVKSDGLLRIEKAMNGMSFDFVCIALALLFHKLERLEEKYKNTTR